jgi:hypothetical protein
VVITDENLFFPKIAGAQSVRKKLDLNEIKEQIRLVRPKSKNGLKYYIKLFLDVDVPDFILTPEHSSVMDYIWFSFNSDFEKTQKQNADCVVWASRGGGKTETAAIVSTLDCIFKPEIQIRILSGSGYQAGRMYDYYQRFIHLAFEDMIRETREKPVRRTYFKNGATVEIMVQSETSVRGQHVHKLRCDEVELFKKRIYTAAQYTTMSSKGYIAAREVISTMHRPYGLMKSLITQARELNQPIFKWNVWDVIENCTRKCEECPLSEACEGKAKKATGYYKIDDALTQLERAKKMSFGMEMLCGEGSKKKWGSETGCRRY